MLRRNNQLILARKISVDISCESPKIDADYNSFINDLIGSFGVLPPDPPFELHPYKKDFPLQEFEKYIIGTFPPISYVLDDPAIMAAGINGINQPAGVSGKVITHPWIPFYHGNQGSMWDYLLTPTELSTLKTILAPINNRSGEKQFLIKFLTDKKINYADIIDSTQRKRNKQGQYDSKDRNLYNICPNKDLICHILTNPKAKYLLFNTGSTFSNDGLKINRQGLINIQNNVRAFDLFVRACQELGLVVEIQIQQGKPPTFFTWKNIALLTPNQRQNKMAFEMRISNPKGNKKIGCNFPDGGQKEMTIITGPSPSKIAQLGVIGNKIFEGWRLGNPNINTNDFIDSAYKMFRNNDLNTLFNMNM